MMIEKKGHRALSN